ncbi:MAG: glycosyltransferase [Bacteroidetes bacterium]|nr:glycosyltransferase [Bacteroidota bacterium]
MKVLQICNDYFGGKFYDILFSELENNDIQSTVIVFLRNDQVRLIEKNQIDLKPNNVLVLKLNWFYSTIGRVLPNLRNIYIIKRIKPLLDLKDYRLIHAHTVFSNGSLAHKIGRSYNLQYIISVRNTDINTVLGNLNIYRNLFNRIISSSSLMIFPAPSYLKKLKKKVPNKVSFLDEKSIILPNPINDFWIQNIGEPKSVSKKNVIHILFVGEISENKNIEFLLKVFSVDWLENINFKVTLVGRKKNNQLGLKYFEKISKTVQGYSNVVLLEEINDLENLRKQYVKADIFFMASKHETFGLVFIESISQGTPLIYSREEGIDGYFEEGEIGYSTNPASVIEARNKIELVLQDYSGLSKRCIEKSLIFNKSSVVKKYVSSYQKVTQK